ncbi:unnamed protein product [Caenorhabditis auriculariae]|uniref:Uncharacterized protein n=1 Tax=Caenorhabditis auriculariae TaxID=2777116 RepID=A0A8S1HH28_9PELO|nr:unnamed protein product [Caenorhabditis auriculariae]
MSSVLLVAAIFSLISLHSADRDPTLEFVQIWFRHGERLPTHYLRLQNESFDFLDLAYPGELTNRGLQQEYHLGQVLRKFYGDHFGEYYRPAEIFVYTGKDNRTSTSAQALFAGFFPPNEAQKWSSDLLWQPIAQHTDESIDWVSIGVQEDCPSYNEWFTGNQEYREISKKIETLYPDMVQLLREKTGRQLDTPLAINRIFDSLKCRWLLNDPRLPVPDWAEKYIPQVLTASFMLHNDVLNMQNSTIGEYHNEVILSLMEDHMNRKNFKGAFISGHDTNIVMLWKSLSLGAHPDEIPSYGSHLAVELHKQNGRRVVKFWLSMAAAENRTQLTTPMCGEPCFLENLQEITKGVRKLKTDWYAQCKGMENLTSSPTSMVTVIMIIVTAILLLLTLILGCTTLSYRKQLKSLTDPERSRLLPYVN